MNLHGKSFFQSSFVHQLVGIDSPVKLNVFGAAAVSSIDGRIEGSHQLTFGVPHDRVDVGSTVHQNLKKKVSSSLFG